MRVSIFHPKDLSEADIKLLVKACQRMYDGSEAVDLVRKCLDGQMSFWRAENGLFGTSILERGKSRILWIEFVAIPGVRKNLESFFQQLKWIAEEYHCGRISTCVVPGPLQAFYEKTLGLRPKAILYEEFVG